MIKTATSIVKKLQRNGYEAYFAGGSVRDMIRKVEPKDIDIATSAKPERIEKLLSKTKPVGKKFGVILVLENGHSYEIATFRSDSGYSDGRRPDYVTYTNAKEDALRRDFTINGIFFDPIKKEYKDYVNGREDLEKKLLRFIGDPKERIREDNLRILRAIRLKNTLGLTYDPKTWEAICKNASLIKNVSAERIKDEFLKMIDGKFRYSALLDLDKCGILKEILPELEQGKGVKQPKDFHKEGDVFEHTMLAIKSLPKNAPLFVTLAVLFHDIGKPDTYEKAPDRIRFSGHAQKSAEMTLSILKRLKFPKIEIEMITWLVHNHMTIGDISKMREAKRRLFLLNPRMKYLQQIHKADAMGATPMDLKLYKKVKEMMKEEKGKKIPKPLLSGNEIMKELNIQAGPKVGKLIEKVHGAQLEGKVKTKKEALEFIKKY